MLTKTILINIFLLPIVCATCCCATKSLIDIPGVGKIQGSVTKSTWTERKIHQFFGVKYAESPTGDRRYKNPVPALPWSDTRNATELGFGCIAHNSFRPSEELPADPEDCLHMAIYTTDFKSPKPVIVFISGNLFDMSLNSAKPNYILEKDVVLVVPQFRLGPLGFFALDNPQFPGNYGVQDIILALKWIKQNIAHFGGDPNSITLAGHNGGAAIVHGLTMGCDMAESLFHKVIYVSGSLYAQWAFEAYPTRYNNPIFNAPSSDCVFETDKMENCFKTEDAVKFVTEYLKSKKGTWRSTLYSGEVKMVDDNMCIKSPLKSSMGEVFNSKGYPTLVGVPKHPGAIFLIEALEFMFDDPLDKTNLIPDHFIEMLLVMFEINEASGFMKSIIKEKIFKEVNLKGGTIYEIIHNMYDFVNTITYKAPVLTAARRSFEKAPNATFLYTFDYRSDSVSHPLFTSIYEKSLLKPAVSIHEDLYYLFPFNEVNLNEQEKKISEKIIEMWTSFARDGRPNLSENPQPPPMMHKNGPYFHLDKISSIGDNFQNEFTVVQTDFLNGIDMRN